MKTSEIEEILNSFDGITRAKAKPFMYTRVMARLQEENSFWSRTTRILSRPAIAFISLVIIVLINVFSIIKANSIINEQEEITSFVHNTSAVEVLQNDNFILAVNDVNTY